MKTRWLSSLPALALFVAPAFAQTNAAAGSKERSHVERFSSPEVRAERAETEATAKLSANPNDAAALNDRALSRLRLSRFQEAAEDLRRAVALNPKEADYQANLGYALWKLGRPLEAIGAEREAIRINDKNYTGHYQLGRFLQRLGDAAQLPEAAAHLRRALEIDPRQYEVRFELIAVSRALNDLPQVLSQLDLLEDARPSDPRVTYVSALLAIDRGDMSIGIDGLRKALDKDPTLYGAWQDLGLAYIKLKRWPEAVETFAELSKRQADSVDAAYLHALALYNAGRSADAESEARRALRLDAGAASAHTLLGIILASRGNANNEASDSLTQAVALDPNSFDAFFNLGRVQYALKDYAGAAGSLRAAVKLDPHHQEARFFLGTTLEANGEADAALAEYRELIKIDPQSAMGKVGAGALLVKQGKTDEAIKALKDALVLDPKNFEASWAMGRALLLAERYGEAVQVLKTAVALAPERADAHYQLGIALRRLGNSAEAAREFALVERLNTEFRTNTRQQSNQPE